MLPVLGQDLARSDIGPPSVLMAGLIAVPQIVTALVSPWIGYHSEKFGRKPLLLAGFGVEIIRALLFAFFAKYWVLIVAQLLSGVSAAAVTVLTILVVTDLTTGTGRFNLMRGFLGTVIAISASMSTGVTGFIFEKLGTSPGFLILAGLAVIATGLLWSAMPETKPAKYLD
jgi:MFS family permease